MAIIDITKPMALDETLQATNGKMDAIIQKLQGIINALGLDPSVYRPKGNITCAALIPALLIDDNLGNVYNVTDNGTTTSDFVEGAGNPIHVGDNVAIVDVGTEEQSEYKFDLLGGMVDLSNYVEKEVGKGLSTNDYTTIEKNKLAGISTNATKTESSTTNGNIIIDNIETPVYRNYGNNTVLATDKALYGIRKVPAISGFTGYVRDLLKGYSVVWNQLVKTNVDNALVVSGHKYIMRNNGTWSMGVSSGTVTATQNRDFVTDLTLMFGVAIADYIYNLGVTDGRAKLIEWGFTVFANAKYVAYDEGSIKSVSPTGKEIVGFNIWDGETVLYAPSGATIRIWSKNYIRVCPNTTYYFYFNDSSSYATTRREYYDEDFNTVAYDNDYIKNTTFTTPADAVYMKFYVNPSYGTTYIPNTICINVSDANKNGTYEPYAGRIIYPFDNTIDLMGTMGYSNNELTFDGDVETSNGIINRKMAIVDLGDYTYTRVNHDNNYYMRTLLSEAKRVLEHGQRNTICSKYVLNSSGTRYPNNLEYAITGSYSQVVYLLIRDDSYTNETTFKNAMVGQKLVFELTTPTTDSCNPFASPMGYIGATTEEYTDSRSVKIPPAHETQYMGQSNDVTPILSNPDSDGVWVQKCYVSGGKAQYVWELERTQ